MSTVANLLFSAVLSADTESLNLIVSVFAPIKLFVLVFVYASVIPYPETVVGLLVNDEKV